MLCKGHQVVLNNVFKTSYGIELQDRLGAHPQMICFIHYIVPYVLRPEHIGAFKSIDFVVGEILID